MKVLVSQDDLTCLSFPYFIVHEVVGIPGFSTFGAANIHDL